MELRKSASSLLLHVGVGIVPGLAARISTELRIVQLRAVGEHGSSGARDETVHDTAILAAVPPFEALSRSNRDVSGSELPSRCLSRRHTTAAFVGEDHEDEQQALRHGRGDEEVSCHDL